MMSTRRRNSDDSQYMFLEDLVDLPVLSPRPAKEPAPRALPPYQVDFSVIDSELLGLPLPRALDPEPPIKVPCTPEPNSHHNLVQVVVKNVRALPVTLSPGPGCGSGSPPPSSPSRGLLQVRTPSLAQGLIRARQTPRPSRSVSPSSGATVVTESQSLTGASHQTTLAGSGTGGDSHSGPEPVAKKTRVDPEEGEGQGEAAAAIKVQAATAQEAAAENSAQKAENSASDSKKEAEKEVPEGAPGAGAGAGAGADEAPENGNKKRRMKIKQCVLCGASSTPQWRTGPTGSTVCNKCGVRWRSGRLEEGDLVERFPQYREQRKKASGAKRKRAETELA